MTGRLRRPDGLARLHSTVDAGRGTIDDADRPAGSISLQRIDAVIFDMDGVVTDTARTHAAAWKRMFDHYLRERGSRTGERLRPFDAEADYRSYVDGKPRYDGVRSFLASRGITLPDGEPSDPVDRETVCGLGNRKNASFLEELRDHGAAAYPSTVALLRELRRAGVPTAVVSASRNLDDVLEAATVSDLFDVRLSGSDAETQGLPGKPDPATFLEAARRLRVDPGRAAVVEDALAGVTAGRAGRFGLVIGVDRVGQGDALRDAGADVVVADLGEVRIDGGPSAADGEGAPRVRDLPLALANRDELSRVVHSRPFAVFLDYDGTLTPIVERPEDAAMTESMRAAVGHLASRCPVAVVSGRDLDEVRTMVAVDGVVYAGSHGFDIEGPDGLRHRRGTEFIADADRAADELAPRLDTTPGARLERKAFGLAVHVRQVDPSRIHEVESIVHDVAGHHPRLRVTTGKKVFELRPVLWWDKGRAVRWLLDVLGLAGRATPIYVGDDETDEDAFQAIRGDGLGLVVRGEADDRPTAARFAFQDTGDVERWLEWLADQAPERSAS